MTTHQLAVLCDHCALTPAVETNVVCAPHIMATRSRSSGKICSFRESSHMFSLNFVLFRAQTWVPNCTVSWDRSSCLPAGAKYATLDIKADFIVATQSVATCRSETGGLPSCLRRLRLICRHHLYSPIISERGYAVAQLVEALRYKPEGRGFDSRWSHWNFSVT